MMFVLEYVKSPSFILTFPVVLFQAFYPQPVYDENSEVDEEVLKKVIDEVLVSDAIAVYQLLQKKGQSKSHQRTKIILHQISDILWQGLANYRWQVAPY
jgi:hypothetical protein